MTKQLTTNTLTMSKHKQSKLQPSPEFKAWLRSMRLEKNLKSISVTLESLAEESDSPDNLVGNLAMLAENLYQFANNIQDALDRPPDWCVCCSED